MSRLDQYATESGTVTTDDILLGLDIHDHSMAASGTVKQVPVGNLPFIQSAMMTALGDFLYGGAAGAVTRLPGNITTTRKFMRQAGTGTASAAPAWDTLTAADIPQLPSSKTNAAGLRIYLDDLGADNTGAALSDAAWTSAYSSAVAAIKVWVTDASLTSGVIIMLGTGIYKFSVNVIAIADSRIGFEGLGKILSRVTTTGSAGTIVSVTSSGSEPSGTPAAPVGGFTIWDWDAGSSNTGFKMSGTRLRSRIHDIDIAGVGTSGKAFWFTPGNGAGFEGTEFTGLSAQNCGFPFTFDGSSTSPGGSLDYTWWDVHVVACSTALTFINNAHMYGSTLFAHGNIGGGGFSGAVTACSIGASTSDAARIQNTNLYLQFEADSGSTSITDLVITGTSNSGIIDCSGSISFLNAGGTMVGGSLSGSAMFSFQGPIENCPLASSMSGSKYQLGRTLSGVDSTAQGSRLDSMGSIQYTSDAVQAPATGGTINTATDGMYGIVPVNPTAAVTGVILQAPSRTNSVIKVVNRSAFSITFAASGTSHVASATSYVIPALSAASFTYDAGTSLWYPG